MKFKNAKMTTVKAKNPFPNPVVASDAAITYSPFVVRKIKAQDRKDRLAICRSKKLPLRA